MGRFRFLQMLKRIRRNLMNSSAGVTGWRAKLQLGATGSAPTRSSRYYTNLTATGNRIWADAAGVNLSMAANPGQAFTCPYDWTTWDSATGGIIGKPPGATQVAFTIAAPFPKGNELGRWIRVWTNRPEAVMDFQTGYTSKGALTAWRGGVYRDFYYTWATPLFNTAGDVATATGMLTPPNVTGDGTPATHIYAAEIYNPAVPGAELLSASVPNTSWDWIHDPAVFKTHPPSTARLRDFGILRAMDLQGTNFTSCMAIPTTYANRGTFGSVPGGKQNTAVHAIAQFQVNGLTVTLQSSGYGFTNAETPGTLYQGTPWRPFGALGNAVKIQIAVSSSISVPTYTFDKTTKLWVATVPTGTTWDQFGPLFLAYANDPARRGDAVNIISTLGPSAVPAGLTGVPITPIGPIQMFGGAHFERRQELPVELAVEMCNRENVDLWWQFPLGATEDWLRYIFAYLRDNLAPGLKVYAELQNEVWNFKLPFSAWGELTAWGIANNPYGYGQSEYAKAAYWAWGRLFLDKMLIARSEFETTGRRLLGVHAAQYADNGGSWESRFAMPDLGQAWADQGDFYAVAPYWNTKFGSEGTPVRTWLPGVDYSDKVQPRVTGANPLPVRPPILIYGNAVYAILDDHTSAMGSEPGTAGGAAHYALLTPAVYEELGAKAGIAALWDGCRNGIAFAKARGKPMICYESGMGDAWVTGQTPVDVMASNLSRAPETRRMTAYWLWQSVRDCGPETIHAQFGDSGPAVAANMWQYQDFPGAPDNISPKRLAFQDFVANGPTFPYGLVNLTNPRVTRVGSNLTAVSLDADWTVKPDSYEFQWYRKDDTAIAGATSALYAANPAVDTTPLYCDVTAVKGTTRVHSRTPYMGAVAGQWNPAQLVTALDLAVDFTGAQSTVTTSGASIISATPAWGAANGLIDLGTGTALRPTLVTGINGLPCMLGTTPSRFNISNALTTAVYTYAVLFKYDGSNGLLFASEGNSINIYINAGKVQITHWGGGNPAITTATGALVSGEIYCLVVTRAADNTLSFWLDDTLAASGKATVNPMAVGTRIGVPGAGDKGGFSYAGQIQTILKAANVISQGEVHQLSAFLMWKAGTQAKLPTDSSYRTERP